MVRLDRVLISPEWTKNFPNTTQRAHTSPVSDHTPLVCTAQTKFPASNVFRFENAWLKNQRLVELVCQTWESQPLAESATQLQSKLRRLTKKLTAWKKEYQARTKEQEKLCTDFLCWLAKKIESRGLTKIEKVLRIVMKERHNQLVLEQEENWRQRAKQNWLELGDKNTRFFHQMASARKRNHTIETIKKGEITLVEHKQKAAAFYKHFIKLIGTHHMQQERFDYSALYTHEDLNWD